MTRQASSNSLTEMVKDLRPFLSNIVISFDGDKDDDEDDKDDENDEGGDDASGDGTGSSKEGSKDDIKDPDKKKLSDEAAAHRVRAKSEKERADKAEAELRKLTDKDKSELEKAQRDLTEAQARISTLEARDAERSLQLAFFESGASALFKNPAKARLLLDLSSLKPDDDGVFNPKEVKALADALLKSDSYLAADGSDSGSGSSAESGAPSNGRKTKQTDNAALVKKFPALAGRS